MDKNVSIPIQGLIVALLAVSAAWAAADARANTCILELSDGLPAAGAEFHVFAFDRAQRKTVEIASGTTTGKGEFQYSLPDKGDEALPEWAAPPPQLYVKVPDVGIFFAQLRGSEEGARIVRLTGTPKDLTVRFLLPDGSPAQGVRFRAGSVDSRETDGYFGDTPPLPEGWLDGTTGAEGRLILRGLPNQFGYYLEHEDARFAQLMGRLSARYTLDPGREYEVRLIPAGAISGAVTFPDGRPAAGVYVRILEQYHYDEAGGGGGETRTDAEGRFSIGQLRPAAYDIEAELPDELAEQWAAPLRRNVRLREGEALDQQDIRLTKGVVVHGRVTNGRTGELLSGAIPSIGLVAADQTSPLGLQWAKAVDGQYRARVPASAIKVYIGGGISRFERAESVELTARDGEEAEVNFPLQPRSREYRIRGKVVAKDGAPAANVTVRLPHSLDLRMVCVTDAQGRFEFEVPEEIRHGFRIAAEDTGRRSRLVPAKAGDDVTLVLEDGGGASITGRVVDEQGNPVEDAEVRCDADGDGENWNAGTRTDEQGRFEFRNVWGETSFALYFNASGFGPASRRGIRLEFGQEQDIGDLRLKVADQKVEGLVVDAEDRPEEVKLQVYGKEQPSLNIAADETGRFRIEGLVPGPLSITAHRKMGGQWVRVGSVATEAGRDDVLLVTKKADAAVRGRLLDEKNKPVAGATVAVDDTDQPGSLSAVTNENGEFALSGVFPSWL